MDLSVVIVNWNTRELLARCLESVVRHHAVQSGSQQSTSTEIIVVDNASTDGSPAMVTAQFPQVHLIENRENLGFASANNQAVRLSGGRYVLLLNSDTEVYSGAIQTLVQFMSDNPQAGGCGPLLLNADDSLQVSCYPMLTPGREFWRLLFLDRMWRRATYNQERWDRRVPRRVEVVKGACLLLRKVALDEVGLLDEQYFMYTEEFDLCSRLAQAGWQLWWVPQAVIRHYGEASSGQMAEAMFVQLYRSRVQLYRKLGGPRRVGRYKRILRAAYVPRLIVSTLGAPVSKDLALRARRYRRLLAELSAM